jgi:hypothetical protein
MLPPLMYIRPLMCIHPLVDFRKNRRLRHLLTLFYQILRWIKKIRL